MIIKKRNRMVEKVRKVMGNKTFIGLTHQNNFKKLVFLIIKSRYKKFLVMIKLMHLLINNFILMELI